MSSLSPELVADISNWIYPACLVCALLAPLIRTAIRKFNGFSPCFSMKNFGHDMHGGAMFPFFFLMLFIPVAPGIHIEPIAYALSGLYGMTWIFRDLADND